MSDKIEILNTNTDYYYRLVQYRDKYNMKFVSQCVRQMEGGALYVK